MRTGQELRPRPLTPLIRGTSSEFQTINSAHLQLCTDLLIIASSSWRKQSLSSRASAAQLFDDLTFSAPDLLGIDLIERPPGRRGRRLPPAAGIF